MPRFKIKSVKQLLFLVAKLATAGSNRVKATVLQSSTPKGIFQLRFRRQANLTMPGHIKLVKGAVDPDPTEYLLPSHDQRKEDQNKPFDSKKSVWVPDPKTGGYR